MTRFRRVLTVEAIIIFCMYCVFVYTYEENLYRNPAKPIHITRSYAVFYEIREHGDVVQFDDGMALVGFPTGDHIFTRGGYFGFIPRESYLGGHGVLDTCDMGLLDK